MPLTLSDEQLIEGLRVHGSAYMLAKAMGMSHSNLLARLKRKNLLHLQTNAIAQDRTTWTLKEQDFLELDIEDGSVLVASDFHIWPGARTTGQRALLRAARELKPVAVVANGDVFDGNQVSRFPASEWNKTPTMQEELRAAREYMDDLAEAAGRAHRIWVMGNHDQRFTRALVAQAAAFEGVEGFDIRDHFPAWKLVYRLTVNPDAPSMTDVCHNWNNGIHAAYNNALRSGVNYVTGHTHRLQYRHWADRRGTRYGVETGTLMDPEGPQSYYVGGRPTDWVPGFVLLTYAGGQLLQPEFVQVLGEGRVAFRGKVWEV